MKHRIVAKLPWLLISLWLFSLAAPALAATLDPAAEEFYHMTRYFMTRDEDKAFRNLSTPELRQEFIKAFWIIRDPDPLTVENEFRNELEERFEFVNKYLREANRPGWDTARGMVYLVLGPPTTVNASETSSTLSASRSDYMPNSVVWPYNEMNFAVWFIDRQGYGVFELDMINTSPRLLELMKAAKTRPLRNLDKGMEDRFLEFKAEIEPASNRLLIAIPVKELRFDIGPKEEYTARIHLAVNLYLPGGTIATYKDDRRIALDPEVQKKGRLVIEWTIPLAKGKNQVDLLVLDQVSGRSNRQLIAVKKK